MNRIIATVAVLGFALLVGPAGALGKGVPKTKPAATNHNTPFSSADCGAVTRFKGVTSDASLSCDSPQFFVGNKLPNTPPTAAGWSSLPICLGIAPHINDYLTKHPGKCRRLDSSTWTPALNMRFIQCIFTNKLGRGKHLWVTKTSGIDKKYLVAGKPAWPNLVTSAEMCYVLQLAPRLFPGD